MVSPGDTGQPFIMSNPSHRLPGKIISIYSVVKGPKGKKTLRMILDTGASYTMIPVKKSIEIGYDPLAATKKIEILTASGTEYVPIIKVASFKCLGVEVKDLDVVCHDLPPWATVDGLLGLNFLCHYPPFIDFYKKLSL